MAKKESNDNSDDMIVDLDRDDMVIDDSKVATAAEEKCRELIASLDQRNSWQYSSKGVQAKRAAKAINSLKHGTYARVPIICKGDGCPYGRSCYLLQNDLAPEREPCPIEADKVERLVAGYAKDFDIDDLSFTDRILLKEIINCDIIIDRCMALMQEEGTPVIDMAIGCDKEGNEVVQPNVSKAWEALERISKKRNTDYQLMLMTRKDRKKDGEEDEANALDALLNNISAVDITNVQVKEKEEG